MRLFKEFFMRNFDFRKRCKNVKDNNEKTEAFPKNRFKSCSESWVHSDSVGVKLLN